MNMLHCDSDYMEGAHPTVMQRLVETNLEQTVGYGEDEYSRRAADLIREACGQPDALVRFLVGGTQTNATVIDGLLHQYEGVMAADTGHINNFEAGAVESSGHKILIVPSHEGKVAAYDIDRYLTEFYENENHQHMVSPGALYLSFPTEWGTLYSLGELEALSRVCHKYNIPLYMDGARLGYGLAASKDVTLKDIARLCDVFYIGGTKVGAMFGEAVVTAHPDLLPRFFTFVKQHGAMLAKGRLLGVQFSTLFTDNLYLEISQNAVNQALRLKKAMIKKGFSPYVDSPTNQQFFCLPKSEIERIGKFASFEIWAPCGPQQSVVRFVTSWNTSDQMIDEFISKL